MQRAIIAAVVIALAATPCLARAATQTVTISDFTFAPAAIRLHPGDTVIWSNQDSTPHTATARDGKSFDTGTIDPGGSARVTFQKAGDYPYRCAIHPDMLGEVDVR